MKKLKSILNFFLLLTVLIGTANTLYSLPTHISSEDTTVKIESITTDQNSNSVFVEEVSVSEIMQSNSENEFILFSQGFSALSQTYISQYLSEISFVSFYYRDQRRIIEQQLFPFHFFL